MVLPSLYFLNNLKRSTTVSKDVGVATEFLDQYFTAETSAAASAHGTHGLASYEMTDLSSKHSTHIEELDEENLLKSSHLVPSSFVARSSTCNSITTAFNTNECLVIDLDNDATNTINSDTPSIDAFNALSNKLKSKLKARRDPSINNVYVSMATIKYAFIALATLGLLGMFLFFVIIGLITLNKCVLNQHLPIYLIVLGFSGITRIILSYTCSYSFSKSILVKMYEHLVWRLVINRCKASYYYSIERSMKYRFDKGFDPSTGANNADEVSITSLLKYNKCTCFFNFILNFFFCHCICCKICCAKCFQKNKNSNFDADDLPAIITPVASLAANRISHSESKTNRISEDTQSGQLPSSKSFSNVSRATLTNGSLSNQSYFFNDLNCFNLINKNESESNLSKSSKPDSSLARTSTENQAAPTNSKTSRKSIFKKLKRSRSASDVIERASSKKKMNSKQVEFNLTSKRSDNASYGNRYFNGKYGYNYGTHRRLHRHHNKTHKPIRLLDFRSIRYCIAYLIQRCIDVFMLSWFICGNYWVFSSSLDTASASQNNTITNRSNVTSSLSKYTRTSSLSVYNMLNSLANNNLSVYTNNTNEASNNNSKSSDLRFLQLKSKAAILNASNSGVNASREKEFKRIAVQKVYVSINNYTAVNNAYNTSTNLVAIGTAGNIIDGINLLCYHIAFIQIISTYAFFALIVILVIVYQVRLVVCVKKIPERRAQNRTAQKRVIKSNSFQLSSSKKLKRITRSRSLPVNVNKSSFRR
jgi:hypothetical protein